MPTILVNLEERDFIIWWTFVHCLQIFLMAVTILHYSSLYESFNTLVKLIFDCIDNVKAFSVMFFGFNILWCILYDVCGFNMDNGNKLLNHGFSQFVQQFNNAIGNISSPSIAYWTKPIGNDLDLDTYQSTMVYWASFVTVISDYVFVIVLLKIMIAVISQSYDETVGQ